jgi:hypothetical protein
MTAARIALALFTLTLLAGCASTQNDSDREWQRAQCDRVVDPEDRDKCLKRVDAEYGSRGKSEPTPPPKR